MTLRIMRLIPSVKEYNEDSDYSDVVIDGKRVTWEDLGMFLSRYQGFQIKI